jgi:hypothetical protein
MKNPADEWRHLTALYAEMGDTELLELKASLEDLTEVAQDVLRDEMKKRELWDLPLPQVDSPDEEDAEPHSLENLRLAGAVVGQYDTVNEANLAGYVLELAGIQAVVVNNTFDLTLPALRVAPRDAVRATTLLGQPISAGVRADYEATRNLPDFEVPVCPHCHCEEVLLEEVEPCNQWLCEECGHRWADATPLTEPQV